MISTPPIEHASHDGALVEDGATGGPELRIGGGFALAAVLVLAGSRTGAAVLAPRLSYLLCGLLLIGAAAFLTAALTAMARRRGPPREHTPAAPSRSPRWPLLRLGGKLVNWIERRAAGQDWRGDWLPIITPTVLGLASLGATLRGWRTPAPLFTTFAGEIAAASLLMAAFPLLVLERRYAGMSDEVLPESAALARVARVPLFGMLGLAIAAGLHGLGLLVATLVEEGVAVLTALVATEVLLRSAAYLFLPLPPLPDRRSHVDSILARAIRLRLPDRRAVRVAIQAGLGIDLAHSWALRFIARSIGPVLAAMIVVGWLLSGVTAVGTGERAVYEAFGQPRAVLRPGLHLHLPWPLGVVRSVKFGAIQQVAISFDPENMAKAPAAPGTDMVEGDPRPEEDRLWDNDHPDEGLFLVASKAGGGQSFEVMGADMDVLYRVGVTDTAAMQSIYTIEAPETLVRSLSSRILVQYFARSTLDGVLGRDRETFVRQFQAELQRELTRLSSGIEVMSIVVEEVHPPLNAASAYQNVQAAVVRSAIKIDSAKAEAVREMKVAAQVAAATRNDAQAAASVRVSAAKTDLALFVGDRQAYAAGGPSFLFERRLNRVGKVLADKPIVILDHRVSRAMMPTLDMRGDRTLPEPTIGDREAD